MKMRIVFFTMMTLCNVIYSQNVNNIWYFAGGCGIDFNQMTPILLNGNAIPSEVIPLATSTICDNSGSILFYSDGFKVWDKNNSVMPNGTNLPGSQNFQQGTLIVPFVNDPNKFYLFTTEFTLPAFQGKLFLNVVDMSLRNGLGEVTESGIEIGDGFSIRLVSVLGECGKVWVVTNKSQTNKYCVYGIDENGVDMDPIISNVGLIQVNNGTSNIKASPQGDKLVVHSNNKIEILRFDSENGLIFNPIILDHIGNALTGCFSPNGNLLYTMETDNLGTNLYQYDVSTYDSLIIENSKTLIFKYGPGTIGQDMQNGPDSSIYVNPDNGGLLGVINMPNRQGLDCEYKVDGLDLTNCGTSVSRFNNLIVMNRLLEISKLIIPDTMICPNNVYKINVQADGATYKWDDGSADSHREISVPGEYWLERKFDGCTQRDSFYVNISNFKPLDIVDEYEICLGDSVEFFVENTWDFLSWNDGITSFHRFFKSPGVYKLTVQSGICIDSATIWINQSEDCNESFSIYIPNVFSPNGDGVNDELQVFSNDTFTSFIWRIWDRWGNLVFSTTDPATSWNGMMGHRLAPLGVYVYSIRGRTAKGELNEQGTVTLVY